MSLYTRNELQRSLSVPLHQGRDTPSDTSNEDRRRAALNLLSERSVNDRQQRVSAVSRELRDRFNNSLQEIIAMVTLVKLQPGSHEVRDEALHTIHRAAQDMASLVTKLEDRLLNCVEIQDENSVEP